MANPVTVSAVSVHSGRSITFLIGRAARQMRRGKAIEVNANFTSGTISIEPTARFDGDTLAVGAVLASLAISSSQTALRDFYTSSGSIETNGATTARTALIIRSTAVGIRVGSALVGRVANLATTALSVEGTAIGFHYTRVVCTYDTRISTAIGVEVTTAGNIVAKVVLSIACLARIVTTIGVGETTRGQRLLTSASVGSVVTYVTSLR